MNEAALQSLAVRSAEGDLEAMEDLIRGVHNSLFSFLYLLRVPEKDMEDVAQNVVIEVYQSLATYQSRQEFLPWLRGIARHVVANYWRGRGRDERRASAFQQYLVDQWGQKEGQQTWPDTEKSQVEQCMERLQERQKTIVTMRYFDDLDSSVIGKKLDMKPNAVRQILTRVRELLKNCVQSSAQFGFSE